MRRITVLVIDDDEMITEIVRLVLEKPIDLDVLKKYDIRQKIACDVLTASNGVDATKLMNKQSPDVILLDVEMPYMDGIQFLQGLREDPELKGLPVVMLTASTDRRTVIKTAKLGVIDYLRKPFLPEDLIDRLVKAAAPGLGGKVRKPATRRNAPKAPSAPALAAAANATATATATTTAATDDAAVGNGPAPSIPLAKPAKAADNANGDAGPHYDEKAVDDYLEAELGWNIDSILEDLEQQFQAYEAAGKGKGPEPEAAPPKDSMSSQIQEALIEDTSIFDSLFKEN